MKPSRHFYSALIIAGALLFVIGVIGGIFFGRQLRAPKTGSINQEFPPTSPTANLTYNPTGNWQIYRNTKYGYTIQYPQTLYISDTTGISDDVYLKNIEIGTIDVSIIEGIQNSNPEVLFEEIQKQCNAGGPGPQGMTSVSCDSTVKRTPITNDNGLSGYELYLRRIEISDKGDKSQTIGPIYVLNISKSKYLVINPWRDVDWNSKNNYILKQISDSAYAE